MTSATLYELFPLSFRPYASGERHLIDVDRARLARRAKALARVNDQQFHESNVIAFSFAPFDNRWMYAARTNANAVADRQYLEHVVAGTEWLVVGERQAPRVTSHVVIDPSVSRLVPLHTISAGTKVPNLSREARQYLLRHNASEEDLFHHAIAVLTANGGDSLRIPLPDDRERLRVSALVGSRLTRTLTHEESPLDQHVHDQHLCTIAVASRTGKEARMLRASVLGVDERWKEEEWIATRPYSRLELAALEQFAIAASMRLDEVLALLGTPTCDVYLNDRTYWKNVPIHVWRHIVDARAPLRAWISARTAAELERPLLREEVEHVASTARQIATLLLLRPTLVRNLEAMTPRRTTPRPLTSPEARA